ncbi:MAG: hypothetical protein BWY66_01003 [bacterium ADurb.Bin374]|nr:MAG: hypothetical protein BWY66_01003 [bacterium ADurb.Bin374]
MAGIQRRHHFVPEDAVRIVGGALDLLDDHRPLGVDRRRIEDRPTDHVGVDLERFVEMNLLAADIVMRIIERRARVGAAAETFDLAGDRADAAGRRALEERVLEKMRDPVRLGNLVPAARPDPDVGYEQWRGAVLANEDRQAVRKRDGVKGFPAEPGGAARGVVFVHVLTVRKSEETGKPGRSRASLRCVREC